MRVIAGTARGRRLKSLDGSDTRPTTDMVKEAIFNIIQFEIEQRRFLDLFAGTGQMGIEALSRGAKYVTFVEQSRLAAGCVRDNVKLTGFENKCEIMQTEALSFLNRCGKYDVIFLDPPYKTELLEKALEQIAEFDILADDGIIVCEYPANKDISKIPGSYMLKKSYKYGKIKVSVITKHEIEGAENL